MTTAAHAVGLYLTGLVAYIILAAQSGDVDLSCLPSPEKMWLALYIFCTLVSLAIVFSLWR